MLYALRWEQRPSGDEALAKSVAAKETDSGKRVYGFGGSPNPKHPNTKPEVYLSFLSAIPVVGKIIEGVINLVDKAVLDKDEAAKIKAELSKLAFTQDHEQWVKMIEEQSQIIQTEAQGSWLRRSWRPILMFVIIAIVANNYLLGPYLSS